MANIAAIPQFNNYIEYGQNKIPLDTARDFQVTPEFTMGRQTYNVTIWVDTLDGTPNKKRIGYGAFIISADTLEKANTVISRLIECNVKWYMKTEEVTLDFTNRTIDLFYETNAHQGQLGSPKNIINWGTHVMLFKDALGLESPDYNIECVSPIKTISSCCGLIRKNLRDRERIRITFQQTPDVQDKMRDLILKLDKLSGNDVRFKNFFDSSKLPDECEELPLRFDESYRPSNLAHDFHMQKPPSYPDNMPTIADSAGFEFSVTEEAIQATRMWGLNPGPWKPYDVLWLIANSKQAPVQMAPANVAEGILGHQMPAVQVFEEPRANPGAGNGNLAYGDEGRG